MTQIASGFSLPASAGQGARGSVLAKPAGMGSKGGGSVMAKRVNPRPARRRLSLLGG